MRRQSCPPIVNRLLLIHNPVILRFFNISFNLVKFSSFHWNLPAHSESRRADLRFSRTLARTIPLFPFRRDSKDLVRDVASRIT